MAVSHQTDINTGSSIHQLVLYIVHARSSSSSREGQTSAMPWTTGTHVPDVAGPSLRDAVVEGWV